MLPTVRQILAMPVLATADPEVLAGQDQLDRPVRWLHPAEVADIAHLLRGDEIVLMTGVILGDDAQRIRDYVRSLAVAGAAGVVVELGRKWSSLPEALISACRREDLVLIALHREVRFASIVEEVGARILDTEIEELRASEYIHETFTRLDVDGARPEEILAAVVRIASVPVVLESSRHQVVGYDTAGRSTASVLGDWGRRSRGIVPSGRTGYDRRTGWLMTVVGSRGDDWGRLVLLTDTLPNRRDYVLIERAAAALALHQMRSRARDGAERNTHTALLGELRAGRITNELVVRCEAAHLPVRTRRFVAIALRGRLTAQDERQWSLTDLATVVVKASRSLGTPMLVGLDTDHVIALTSMPVTMSPDAMTAALAQEVRKTASVTIARSEVVDRLEDTFRTLIDARHILDAAEADDPRPWITLADVHLRGLVHLLRDDERIRLYVRRELGPLQAYDADRGTSLMTLLRVFLEEPGGKAAAAKRLLLSRPVLYERLARIESILEVDLEDPHIRTSLHVAVLAWSLADEETHRSHGE
ncbi:PucR family transcriptional regulator ligand-binding domain-containing protein [Streptomyces sp. NPDC047042]|uniref:PucR family transcriptional regulator n=1 Tax=Streptomyces sp. NPDC047042 TaxID=3154807 RepID=UPI0033D0A443